MSVADTADSLVSAARRLIDAGNVTGAEALLRRALAADPECVRAHNLMALALFHRGRWQAAVQQADIALGLDANADAFRFKALALIKLKRHQRAIEAAQDAVRAEPTQGLTAFTLAVALENANRPAEAEAQFRRAVALDPGSDVFRGNLGRFLLRRGDVAGAEAVVAELDPAGDAEAALLLRGDLALIRGRPNEARDFALWVLSHNAVSEPALRLLVRTKASRSWFLGLWWRYSMFVATRPAWVRFLVVAPLLLLALATQPAVALLVFGYLYACGLIFARMVARELKGVSLRKGF